MKRRNWLILIFIVTIIVSIFIFIKYEGYNGMFDFLKTDQIEIDTIEVKFEVLPMVEPLPDTVFIYYVIIGSFKDYNNAVECSKEYDFSDILSITEDGWYRVTRDYFFDKNDADSLRNEMGEDIWILKDKLSFEI